MTVGKAEKKLRPSFRQEVLQARSARSLGSIRIGRQPRFTAVALASLGFAAMLIAYAVWGQATRKARVAGVPVPSTGSIALTTPQMQLVLGTDHTTTQGNTEVLVAQSLAQHRCVLEAERSLRLLKARQRVQSFTDLLHGLDVEQLRAERETQLMQRRAALAIKTQFNQRVHQAGRSKTTATGCST